ncbi:MAG: NAD(P)/FAD-dependent oxidoreductase [Chitinophagales bacterium]
MRKKIAITGAGLVGSLWTLFLGQKGYAVDVFERRPDMRKKGADSGRSINLALSRRGLKALEKVGLLEEVKKMAIPMHGRLIHELDGSTHLQPYGREGEFINSISRGGLNKLLVENAEKLENVNFHFEQPCEGFDKDNLQLLVDGKSLDYDLVFGTDGAFSAIRSTMQRTDRFDYEQKYLAHGYKELSIKPNADGSFKMENNALHIWPRKKFMLIALPNQDGSFTCTLFLAFEGSVSFEQLKDEASVNAFFEEYFPDAKALMPHLTEEFFENPTSSLVTVKCFPWTYGDKYCLLGDAAHAIVPFYGQGMNAGFEDCYLLDEMWENNSEKWPEMINTFGQMRKPDGDAIADLALHNFIEMRDLVADEQFLLQKKIEKAIQEKYPNDFKPMYSLVTFSDVSYSEAWQKGQQYNRYFQNRKNNLKEIVEKIDRGEADEILEKIFNELVNTGN